MKAKVILSCCAVDQISIYKYVTSVTEFEGDNDTFIVIHREALPPISLIKSDVFNIELIP